ncbi:hypothetical protein CROQUDRAFT_42480, partial [Cronartium quercuum f. sp. fusiforme G11]
DEIGLFAMACWHDHCLKFINVEKSGEKAHCVHALLGSLISRTTEEDGPHPRIGVLYDIGCTLEKGITKVSKCLSGSE